MTETGLPGLTLYTLAIIFGFLALHGIFEKFPKAANESILAISRTLFFSYFAFVVCALLSTNAYTFHVPLMSGLVLSFARFAKPELEKQEHEKPADPPLSPYEKLRQAPALAR